jgi:hypothetical protein
MAIGELNMTRVRLSIPSGVEGFGGAGEGPNTYAIVNDNANPDSINPGGFVWTAFDWEIDNIVGPWRQKVFAAGLVPYVNLQYVDFGASAFEHYQNPQEYAEFMLAVFQHTQSRYGFVPDAITVMLEPDNVSGWTPEALANSAVATAQRLAANGFAVPEFIGPETSNLDAFQPYVDQMMAVPGAAAVFAEFSYHRYGGASVGNLQAIASRGVQHGKRTSMLEFWSTDANYRVLHQDLTFGRNSAWQQGVFADRFGCASSHLIRLVNGSPQLCPGTRTTRQYMKYIRPGAQRIGASTANGSFDPVAFVNTDGRWVVVIASEGGSGSFSVGGLPAGTYSLSYTEAGATQATTTLPGVTIVAGQNLSTSMPGAGALTIVSASGSTAPPLPAPPPPPGGSDPTSPPATSGGCSTPDPFASLGGGVCVGGDWLPPGYPGGTPSDPPPSLPVPAPSPGAGCTGPDPFAALGGGFCANGQWLPPGYPTAPGGSAPTPPPPTQPSLPPPEPAGCTIADPFLTLGGGVCVGGNWLPPAYPGAPATVPPPTAAGPGGCVGFDPFASLTMLIGRCVNGDWLPMPAIKTSGTVRFFAIGDGLWAIVGPDGTVYEPTGGLDPSLRIQGLPVYVEAELPASGASLHPSGVLVTIHSVVAIGL